MEEELVEGGRAGTAGAVPVPTASRTLLVLVLVLVPARGHGHGEGAAGRRCPGDQDKPGQAQSLAGGADHRKQSIYLTSTRSLGTNYYV